MKTAQIFGQMPQSMTSTPVIAITKRLVTPVRPQRPRLALIEMVGQRLKSEPNTLLIPCARMPPCCSFPVGNRFSARLAAVVWSPSSSSRATRQRKLTVTMVPSSKRMPKCSGCGTRSHADWIISEKSSFPIKP